MMAPVLESPTTISPSPPEEDVQDPSVPAAVLAACQETSTDDPDPVQAQQSVQRSAAGTATARPAIEPQALGFLQWLQKELRSTLTGELAYTQQHLDQVFTLIKSGWEVQTRTHIHASTSPASSEALSLNGPPYQAKVEARCPEGYLVTLTVTKRDTGSLVEDLGKLIPWLKAQGYGV